MGLSPDELANLYATYDRAQLEQAIAAGPLQFTREAWIAICAECEKRGIAWDQPPAIAPHVESRPAPTGMAHTRCRQAAIACGALVALGALGAGYLMFSDWHFVKGDSEIIGIVALVFGFLFLVVKKMWDGSRVALWTMGVLLALLILSTSKVFRYGMSSRDLFDFAFFVVPVGLEVMVLRALMALGEDRKAGTA